MISSTFRDMHSERDLLVKSVFPALRERLEPYRINLVDIDLRWGVTGEQADNDQVVEICLKEIDETRPFFIGLLGERYGWVPSQLPVGAVLKFPWIKQKAGASVTELEFVYAAVQPSEAGATRALFFFRDPGALVDVPQELRDAYIETDPERAARLTGLKEWVRQSGCPVYDGYAAHWDPETFDRPTRSKGRLVGLDSLGARIQELLWERLRTELDLPTLPDGPGESPLLEEIDFHERFMEARLGIYVGREQIDVRLHAFVDGDAQYVCLLTGPSGSGKSSALAAFVAGYRQRYPERLLIAHFVGASARSNDTRAMLRRLCLQLQERLGSSEQVPDEIPELILLFRNAIARANESRTHIVVVIDALDHLDPANGAHRLDWLPTETGDYVRVIVSQLDQSSPELSEAWQRRPHRRVEMTPLTVDNQLQIIRDVPLISAKTLDGKQIQTLLENPAAATPLFLLVALEELRGFGSYDKLNDRIASLPRGETAVRLLFIQVIERLEEEFDGDLVKWVLMLISASRRGLSEAELLDLVASAPDFGDGSGAPMRDRHEDEKELFVVLRQLRSYLLRRGNLIGFYHRELEIAVREKYFVNEGDRRPMGSTGYFLTTDSRFVVHRHLAAYFGSQSLLYSPSLGKDAMDLSGPVEVNRRLVEELPWHLAETGDWDSLVSLLCKPPFLNVAYNTDREEILRYWARIESASTHRLGLAYQPMLGDPAPHAKAMTAETLFDMLYRTGHYQQAMEWSRKLIAMYRNSGDKSKLQKSLGQLAAMAWLIGVNAEEPLKLLAEREHICRELNLEKDLLETLANRASISKEPSAISEFERLGRALGNLHAAQHALALRAIILEADGDLPGAMALLREQERICRDLNLLTELSGCVEGQASIEEKLGHSKQAIELFRQQESLCRQFGDKHGLGRSLHAQARIQFDSGELTDALRLLQEAIEVRRTLGDYKAVVPSLASKVMVHERLGDVTSVVNVLRELAETARQAGDDTTLDKTLLKLAETLLDSGAVEEALLAYREREDVCRRLGEQDEVIACVVNQALLLSGLNRSDDALKMLAEQEKNARNSGNEPILQACLGGRAETLYELGQSASALPLLVEEEALCRKLGNREGLLLCLRLQADIFEEQSDFNSAIAIRERLEPACRELNQIGQLIDSLVARTRLLAIVGRNSDAKLVAEDALKLAAGNERQDLLPPLREFLQHLSDQAGSKQVGQ